MKIGKISILLFFAMLVLYVPWTGAVQSESSIVKIDGNEIYINWGSHDGITRGMVFSAYRSKDRSHPSTGEAVDKQEDLMGKIKIFEVFPEYSIGRIVLKVNELRVGDYLELMIDSGGESMEENTQKGAILSMDKGKVEINVGSVDGIQDGLLFDVVRDMALRHPVTGELLERRQYLIGKISVSSVGRSSSVCNVLSGWEDIGVSDEIILSERQRSDMGIDIVKSVSSQPGFAEQELAELLTYEEKPASLPKYFGKISSVNRKAKTAVFSWNKDVDGSGVYQGSQVGLYRKEKVVHPITKAVIGSPEILIGSGSFVRTVKGRGELKILNTETALKKGDIVGIIETRGDVPGVKRTAGTPVGRRVNLRQEAERLTQEVIHIQDDIDELKVLKKRLTSVERGIASQRKLTNQLKKDVEQINEKLTLLVEGGGASLIPSQTTTMELYGAHPAEVKTFRIKYTDEIDVKLQFQDQVLHVSLDVDTMKTKGMTAVVKEEAGEEEFAEEEMGEEEIMDISEIGGETEEVSKPFYIKYLFHIIGGIVGLAVLFFLYTFLQKRGGEKKKPADTGDELDFEEADDEDLEEIEEEEEETVE